MEVGQVLSPDEVSALRRDNRDALINLGFIRILPVGGNRELSVAHYPEGYFDFSRPVAKLTRLRIDSVDFVDRAANTDARVILAKRRAYEAANPNYPRWNPEQYMTNVQKDHTHDLDGIIADANEGKVGKDATHLKLRDHFERHHFDMKDVD